MSINLPEGIVSATDHLAKGVNMSDAPVPARNIMALVTDSWALHANTVVLRYTDPEDRCGA